MTSVRQLDTEAPEIASFFRARITATGLVLVATTRSDGWPRVSPMDLQIIDDRLYVGSMPNAVKAQDLQRDPRCCIITPLAHKDDRSGEAKAFCRAREITDPDEWDQLRARWTAVTGFDIGEPGGAHFFELDMDAAAWQRVEGDDWRTSSWRAGGGVRERVRNGPVGESRDLQ